MVWKCANFINIVINKKHRNNSLCFVDYLYLKYTFISKFLISISESDKSALTLFTLSNGGIITLIEGKFNSSK